MAEKTDKPLKEGFDPSAELWDRIIDDIAEKGAPCLDTVEKLVDDSCNLPPREKTDRAERE